MGIIERSKAMLEDLRRRPDHPLILKEFEGMTWDLWKKLWKEAQTAEQMVGLLHCGFDVFIEGDRGSQAILDQECERIVFYLDVADGFQCEQDFTNYEPFGPLARFDKQRLRFHVVDKAWKVLCDKFFAGDFRNACYPSWNRYVMAEEIFLKLLWFFRMDKWDRDNFPKGLGHHAGVAKKFLVDFTRFVWNFQAMERVKSDWDKRVLGMFQGARPRIVEILAFVGKADLLLGGPFYGVYQDMLCMDALGQVALRKKGGELLPRYESIEDAVANDSPVAMVFVALQVKAQEIERRRGIDKKAKV